MEAPYIEFAENGGTQRIGCGFLFIPLVLVFALWYPRFEQPSVYIFDDAEILSPTEEAALSASLQTFSQSLEASFSVVTVSTVSPRRLSIEADEATDRLDEEQFWLWKYLFPRSGYSITYFFSESPRLLQVRYGRYVRYQARLAGIDYGPKYNALQQLRLANGRPDFAAISQKIRQELELLDVPFYQSWMYKIVTLVDDEFLPLLTIPNFELWNGMASLVAIHIYNFLGHLIPNYFVFTAVLSFLIVLILFLWQPVLAAFGQPVTTPEGVMYRTNTWQGCLVYIASFTFLLVGIFPILGFLVLSGGRRVEDLVTARAMGIAVDFTVPLVLSWYWVLLLIVVTLVVNIIEKLLAIVEQDDAMALLGVLRLLIMVPLAYCILPAWAIVITTCFVLFNGIGMAVAYFLRR
jgi:hypothetical protein